MQNIVEWRNTTNQNAGRAMSVFFRDKFSFAQKSHNSIIIPFKQSASSWVNNDVAKVFIRAKNTKTSDIELSYARKKLENFDSIFEMIGYILDSSDLAGAAITHQLEVLLFVQNVFSESIDSIITAYLDWIDRNPSVFWNIELRNICEMQSFQNTMVYISFTEE